MGISKHKVIVVTPVYEDIEACSCLLKALNAQFADDVFMVVVDDGSVEQPLDIGVLENAGVEGVLLKLCRNVGHQKAIAIGLGYVSEYIQPQQSVIIMDSDGEDIPATITQLLTTLQDEKVDVVVAQRKNRVQSFSFKLFYAIYKRLFSLMTGRVINFGNFMALKPHAVMRLVVMPETSIHVAGAVLASKLRTGVCPLDRGPRYAGQSKMNFVGLALHGFKGLMVFAEDVLVRVGTVCTMIATLSVLGAVIAVILKLIGFSTPGWFSVAFGILVLMFLQTGALALMTLMLTGIVRSGMVTTVAAYQEFVDQQIETRTHFDKSKEQRDN